MDSSSESGMTGIEDSVNRVQHDDILWLMHFWLN